MFQGPTLVQIAQFLTEIGLSVRPGELPESTFLPGIGVYRGVLIVDESRLTYPGDLLHEAGHLAVLDGAERDAAGPDLGADGGPEMAAIAWSYAAAVHLGMDPAIVFHADGYHGSSAAILENFGARRYFGVPLLEWWAMTAGPTYPKMIRWLRS